MKGRMSLFGGVVMFMIACGCQPKLTSSDQGEVDGEVYAGHPWVLCIARGRSGLYCGRVGLSAGSLHREPNDTHS